MGLRTEAEDDAPPGDDVLIPVQMKSGRRQNDLSPFVCGRWVDRLHPVWS